MVRIKVLGGAAAIAAGLAAGFAATAASAAPFGPGPAPGGAPVERVAGGCGPDFHPNPWGHCRPNARGWGYGWGGPRGPYGGRPAYGYGDARGPGGYDDGPRRFHGGY